jgi:hypothetical protein
VVWSNNTLIQNKIKEPILIAVVHLVLDVIEYDEHYSLLVFFPAVEYTKLLTL